MEQLSQEQSNKILSLIHAELRLCEGAITPYVCTMYAGAHKGTLVTKIYEYVTKQGLEISDAILAVEGEYNPNQEIN